MVHLLYIFKYIKLNTTCFLLSIGAAIKIEQERFPGSYQKFIGNPLCFLQFENISLPPNKWQKVCNVEKISSSDLLN